MKTSEVGLHASAVMLDNRGALWYSSLPKLSHTCATHNMSEHLDDIGRFIISVDYMHEAEDVEDVTT